MVFSHWIRRLAAFALLATNVAYAVPTHYIVFTMDDFDHVHPAFYTEVDLAKPDPAATPRSAGGHEASIAYHVWRDGTDLGERTLNLPDLRAEFARDPARGDDAIESHRINQTERSFVLRIPLDEADTIEFVQHGLSERFDLATLASRARSLALADQVPSLQIGRDVTSGNPANRVDILVMGDGYQSTEQNKFNTDAMILHDSFFGLTPYKEYQSFINWTTGFSASAQSGADHPPYLAGCTSPTCCADSDAIGDPLAGQMVNTAFNGKFCDYQIQRLVTVSNSSVLAAAAAYPGWDKIFVLVNDATYGGSGGNISVTSTHTQAKQIILHEYGHSFSHLADEYSSPYPGFPACSDLSGSAPCEANVTNQTAPAQVKWSTWFTPGNPIPTPSGYPGVGLFQGARYLSLGMYRPVDTQCLMQYLNQPFCPVCRQEYVRTLYRGGFGVPAAGIDLIEPGTESPPTTAPVIIASGNSGTFLATVLQPSIGSLEVKWYFDGNAINGATSPSYLFNATAAGPHTLELRVKDLTAFVAPSMAGSLLAHSRSWTIQVTAGDLIFKHGFE